MENYFSEQTLGLILFLYVIFIIVITIYIVSRLKKIKRHIIRVGGESPRELKPSNFIIIGIVAIIGLVFMWDIEFRFLWMLMFIAGGIYSANMCRRKCSYCQKKIKDEAIVCPYCQSNISDSVIIDQ